MSVGQFVIESASCIAFYPVAAVTTPMVVAPSPASARYVGKTNPRQIEQILQDGPGDPMLLRSNATSLTSSTWPYLP